MKRKDRIGLKFIKSSLPFISTDNLYIISGMVNDPKNDEDKAIKEMVEDKIRKREQGKEIKVLMDGKEVWIEK